MIRSIVTVATGTLGSRLLGFARDAMMAGLLGAGPVADAFLAAFQLINVARRMIGEGALNAALTPAYSRIRHENGERAAAAFAGRVLGSVGVTVVAAAALLGLIAPGVIALFAPGFRNADTLAMAVTDVRLMLPYVAFAGPVAVMIGVLSARRRFAFAAFSPLLFNLTLILVVAALMLRQTDPARAAFVIALSIGAAGLLQIFALILFPAQSRIASPVRVAFDRTMRSFLGRAASGVAASGGPQLLMIAVAIIASAQPSAVAWLYFASRLVELPLGLVGMIGGSVLMSDMAQTARGATPGAVRIRSRALELALLISLPATVGLILLAAPIVRLLFEHGAFTASDSRATAQALVWLAAGLPAHALIKTWGLAFFARDDARTPALAVLASLPVSVMFAAWLVTDFGVGGLAASVSIAAWGCALVLAWRAHRLFGLHLDPTARRRLPRILVAAFVMGTIVLAAVSGIGDMSALGRGALAVRVGVLIGVGMLSYGLALHAMHIVRIGQVITAFRR